MVQNYIKVIMRNILRHKGYALINLMGLPSGWPVAFLFCSIYRMNSNTISIRSGTTGFTGWLPPIQPLIGVNGRRRNRRSPGDGC